MARRRRGAGFGGCLFPRAKSLAEPVPAELLSQWLAAAERAGHVPKFEGGLWHPYRRKWANERMHLPLKAVAGAGGWTDVMTLITCYQHTDDATLLAVMSVARKPSGRRVATAAATGR